MRRQGAEYHRDAASPEATAFLTANPTEGAKRHAIWPKAKAIFETLPKEQRSSINQRSKEARLAGEIKQYADFVIAELNKLGLLPC